MPDHRHGLRVQGLPGKQFSRLNSIQKCRNIARPQTKFLGPWGWTIARQHRLLLREVTAGMIRHQDGVTLRRKELTPALK